MVQLAKTSLISFLIFLCAGLVQAQSLFFEERLKETPRPVSSNTVLDLTPAPVFNSEGVLEEPPSQDKPTEEFIQTKKMAQSWAAKLRAIHRRYAAILRTRTTDCNDDGFADYLEALASRGQYEACSALAASCPKRSLPVDISMAAARCSVSLYKWPDALRYYETASRTSRSVSVYTPYMFSFGSFLLVSPYAEQMRLKLKNVSNATDEQIDLLMGAVKFAQLQVAPAGGAEVAWNFIEKGLTSPQSQIRAFFASVKAQTLFGGYRYEEARQVLNSHLKYFTHSDQIWPLGYTVLYANKFDLFKLSEILYKAYVPYAHARSPLPIENNNYNYTELYSEQCKTHLLQETDLAEYRDKVKQWQKAQLTTGDFSAYVQQALREHPASADLLSAAGSLSLMRGDRQAAQLYFWRSHQACPNYNRAHWGLQTLKKIIRNLSYPDSSELETDYLKAIQSVDFGKNTARYILNYGILDGNGQNKLKYGARIWGPYFDFLDAGHNTVYIKSAFELLSETPSLESLRDTRIGGENYPNDNRLWDDVRGVGGATVVADFGELSQIAQGSYNTIGHEIAHQFHFALIESQSPIATCIQALYEKAKERNLFADGYAAFNQYEYFAQAVTYYLVPEASPQRFGLNRTWSVQNDPLMHALVESIEKADGHIDRINCSADSAEPAIYKVSQ